MYKLNEFCNIITKLRKEKGLTQTALAEKLGISAQSISKWECGIGYPDVTMFPVIAEILSVPIGVLFGERKEEKMINQKYQYSKEFAACKNITVYLGNICKVEYVESKDGVCKVEAEGDPVFIRYFDAEQVDGQLLVQTKNPSGSAIFWEPYDREGFTDENTVRIYTGSDDADYANINYLDLQVTFQKNEQTGNEEVICRKRDIDQNYN